MSLEDDAKAAGKTWIQTHIWPILVVLAVVAGLAMLIAVVK
jgi:hypothetical protein